VAASSIRASFHESLHYSHGGAGAARLPVRLHKDIITRARRPGRSKIVSATSATDELKSSLAAKEDSPPAENAPSFRLFASSYSSHPDAAFVSRFDTVKGCKRRFIDYSRDQTRRVSRLSKLSRRCREQKYRFK